MSAPLTQGPAASAAERATLERVWQRLERRLDHLEAAPMVAAQHRRRRTAWAGGLALAAAVALAVVVPAGVGARGTAGAALPPPQDLAAQVAPSAERVALQAQSAAMESWLAALPEQRLVRARTAAATTVLEDGIAVVDTYLAAHAEGTASLPPAVVDDLWRRRVRLLGSLSQVRYAEYTAGRY